MSLLSHGKPVAILQYFTDRIDDYWHILYPPIELERRSEDPFLYFYDISRKATDFSGPFSNEGIYLFKGYDGQWHIHALEISQYALACWLAWRKSGDEKWAKKAMLHVKWLLEHQDENGAWYIKHKNPIYSDLPTPWSSALAQALGISAIVRAYRYEKDDCYLQAAVKACEHLTTSHTKGGLRVAFEIKGVEGFIYEEYPRTQLSGVLNGYISAVLALEELSVFYREAESISKENLRNLAEILPLYDTGYWSLYALDGTLSSGFYHRYVTIQLQVLSERNEIFGDYARRFERYAQTPFCAVRAFVTKIGQNRR